MPFEMKYEGKAAYEKELRRIWKETQDQLVVWGSPSLKESMIANAEK